VRSAGIGERHALGGLRVDEEQVHRPLDDEDVAVGEAGDDLNPGATGAIVIFMTSGCAWADRRAGGQADKTPTSARQLCPSSLRRSADPPIRQVMGEVPQ
jgi:hypothetical protein